METIEDILKELCIVIEKHPDQRIYNICRIKTPCQPYADSEMIVPARVESVTLRSLTIRIDRASMNIRRSLKRIHELSKTCLEKKDPWEYGKALCNIFKETEPFVKGENQ